MRLIGSRSPVHRLGTLKFRLTLAGLLLVAVSAAGTGWLIVRDMSHRAELASLETTREGVKREARAITARLIQLQEVLAGVAERFSRPALRQRDLATLRRELAERAALPALFGASAIVAPDGSVLAAAGDHRNLRLSAAQAFFRQTLQEARPLISAPLGEAAVLLSVPIRDTAGKPLAVLAAELRLDAAGVLREWTDLDPDSEALGVVLDARGNIIAQASASPALEAGERDARVSEAIAAWRAMGEPVEPMGVAERVGEQLVAHAGIPMADWVVMRSVDAEIALGGPREARRQALKLAMGVAVAAGLLLLIIMVVLFLPLRRLEARVRRLHEEGGDDERDWPEAWGELGALSAALREAMQQRRELGAERATLLARMRAVLDHVPLGITLTQHRRFVLVSANLGRMFGYETAALEGQDTRLLYPNQEIYDGLVERIAGAFEAGHPFDEELEVLRRDGSRFWARLCGVPVDRRYPDAGTIWTIEDVSAVREAREALSWQSTHDPLTQLANRREFERLLGEVAGNRRREPVSALFIDLDDFKAVNDQGGHAAGDQMLIAVAELLHAQVRNTDTVARLGGDEFAVLLRSCELEAAQRVAHKMVAAVHAHRLDWEGAVFQVGASIGVVEITPALPQLKDILAAADAACYAAKRAGKGRVCCHPKAAPEPSRCAAG
ncbi:putative diguanylate cyclase DgcE [Burkholderiales bacterium]|nr:putative diguanylate cyclase DgcE [Burkholderiales bacterium]